MLANIKKVVDLPRALSRGRPADPRVTLDLTNVAKDQMNREGHDPVYGVRPLKRFLRRALEALLSQQLISGEIVDNHHMTVDAANCREFSLSVAPSCR